MKTYHFGSIAEINNVIAQLSDEARGPDNGRRVEPAADGDGFLLHVPDEMVEEIDAADPGLAEPDLRPVAKSLVMERLAGAGKLDDAFQALLSRPELFVKWFSPDKVSVYASDRDTIAFLRGVGADPAAMLAVPTPKPPKPPKPPIGAETNPPGPPKE